MDADLQPIHDRVLAATRSEDVFTELTALLPPRLLTQHLAPEVEQMRTVLDESKYSSSEDKGAARLARARFDAFYDEALTKAAKGLYALDGFSALPVSGGRTVTVDGVTYAISERFHEGTHAFAYRGRVRIDNGSAGVMIRLAKTLGDNAYLHNEIRMLDILHRSDVGYWRNLPFMLARFSAGDRVGIIFRYFEGLTLEALRRDPLHVHGLDQKHAVWVLDRMLGLLGYVHSTGVIHGRISPERARVRPSNHNLFLSGWAGAVYKPAITGERTVPSGSAFEAPEVGDEKALGPWTDIYSVGKTIIWLLGGDPVTNDMPDTVEPKLRQFLLNMVPKNPKARPHHAWQLYDAQNRLKDSLWERRFVHLNLTTV